MTKKCNIEHVLKFVLVTLEGTARYAGQYLAPARKEERKEEEEKKKKKKNIYIVSNCKLNPKR